MEFLDMLFIIVVALVVSQVIIPVFKGTPLFPVIRRRKNVYVEQLERANESVEDAQVEVEITNQQDRAERLRSSIQKGK